MKKISSFEKSILKETENINQEGKLLLFSFARGHRILDPVFQKQHAYLFLDEDGIYHLKIELTKEDHHFTVGRDFEIAKQKVDEYLEDFPTKLSRFAIGEKIKMFREEKGWTQEDLAEKVGMNRSNIIRIESGKYSTGQDILSKIANAMGKKLDII